MPFGKKLNQVPQKKKILNPDQLLKYAFWLLGRRAYSEFELRRLLFKKSDNTLDVDFVIQKLITHNLINDYDYALNFVKSRDQFRPRSQKYLRFELIKKGISDEVIKKVFEVINNVSELSSDLFRARALVEKQKQKTKQQLFALLARRGFSYDIVKEVLGEME